MGRVIAVPLSPSSSSSGMAAPVRRRTSRGAYELAEEPPQVAERSRASDRLRSRTPPKRSSRRQPRDEEPEQLREEYKHKKEERRSDRAEHSPRQKQSRGEESRQQTAVPGWVPKAAPVDGKEHRRRFGRAVFTRTER